MTMMGRAVRCAAVAMALCGTPALAQTLDQQWDLCGDKDPDIRIGGCTAVIQSGRETPANVAIAFIKRAIGYERKGQLEPSIQDLSEAIRLDPSNAIALYNRGANYNRLGQTSRALQDYDQAIRLNPSYADALFNRGQVYARQGQHDRAIQDFDQVLRLEPTAADARNERCYSLKALGRGC